MADFGRSVRCVAVKPTGPPVSVTIGASSGIHPVYMDYPSIITSRKVTEEGRRILQDTEARLRDIIERYTEVVKPFRGGVKPHKFV